MLCSSMKTREDQSPKINYLLLIRLWIRSYQNHQRLQKMPLNSLLSFFHMRNHQTSANLLLSPPHMLPRTRGKTTSSMNGKSRKLKCRTRSTKVYFPTAAITIESGVLANRYNWFLKTIKIRAKLTSMPQITLSLRNPILPRLLKEIIIPTITHLWRLTKSRREERRKATVSTWEIYSCKSNSSRRGKRSERDRTKW